MDGNHTTDENRANRSLVGSLANWANAIRPYGIRRTFHTPTED